MIDRLWSALGSALVLILTSGWLAPVAAAQRPITIDDYFKTHEVHDPQLSPDGRWIAYTVKTPLLKKDKNKERIWMVPASGGEPIALTAAEIPLRTRDGVPMEST